MAPFLENQFFGSNVNKINFPQLFASCTPQYKLPACAPNFLSPPLASSPILFCRGPMPDCGCFCLSWEPLRHPSRFLGTTGHPQLDLFPAAFLIQRNPSQLFAGPAHLLAPQVSQSALQRAIRPFKGMFWPNCTVYLQSLFFKRMKRSDHCS